MDGEDEVTQLLAAIRGSGGGNWCHDRDRTQDPREKSSDNIGGKFILAESLTPSSCVKHQGFKISLKKLLESKDVELALRPFNRVHAIQAKELL